MSDDCFLIDGPSSPYLPYSPGSFLSQCSMALEDEKLPLQCSVILLYTFELLLMVQKLLSIFVCPIPLTYIQHQAYHCENNTGVV